MLPPSIKLALAEQLSPARLRRSLTGNTGAIAITAIVQNVLRVLGSFVLTRLLSADAYGAVGVITSVTVTFGLISDIGIAAYVIRSDESDDPRFLDEVWSIRLIRSAILSGLIFVLAGPLANFLDKPYLRWAIAIGGLTFLVDGSSSLTFVTALRHGLVKRLAVIDVVCQIFGLVTAFTLAILFRNYWALIFSGFASDALKSLLSYIAFDKARRRWRPSRERLQVLWSFSRYIAGSTFISLLLLQTDKVVLSKVMPIGTFGLYVLASNLATMPTSLASSYSAKVLYPSYAATFRNSPARLAAQFYAARLPTSILYAFLVAGMIGSGPLIVHILYDDRYLAVGTIVQILGISSLAYLSNAAVNDIMIAKGRMRFTFFSNVVKLAYLLVFGCFAFYQFGVLALIVVVGTIELPALFYGWLRLRAEGLLSWRREAIILSAAGAGLFCGAVANQVSLLL